MGIRRGCRKGYKEGIKLFETANISLPKFYNQNLVVKKYNLILCPPFNIYVLHSYRCEARMIVRAARRSDEVLQSAQ